jgi:type II secretory pathway pseudopilin PulG
MWREYLGYATPALAVINGLIAITIAMLPVRRSVAKLRLGVIALMLGAAAIGAAVYSKYHGRAQDEQQQTDRRDIRERLETFTLEGRTLLGQIRDTQRELPTRSADEWAQRTEIFLRDKLGERYVGRFRKDVNDMYGDAAVPAARLGYWRAVRNRIVNLEMITAELPDQPLTAISSQ